MSLSSFCGRMCVAPLAGVERQGCGSVGGGDAEVGVSCSRPVGPSTVCGTHPFSVLQPQFHQGPSSGEGSPVSGSERSIRARSFTFSRLLQPDFCGDEGLRVVETSYRFVNPQSENPQDSLQDGDPSIYASVCMERRLDGLHRFEGRLLAISSTSGQPQVLQICGLELGFSIQVSLFRSLYGSAGFHTGHGSGFGHSSSSGYPHVSILRRLVDPGFVSPFGHPSLRHGGTPLSGVGDSHQLGEVQSPSIPESGISRGNSRLHSFQGFSLPSESREAMLKCRRILLLRRAASLFLARTPQGIFLLDSSHSGRQATNEIPAAPPSPTLGSRGRLSANSLGSGLSPGSGMVASSWSSPVRHLSGPSQPSPRLLVRLLGRGVGSSSPGRNRFRPLVSGGVSVVNKRKGASCGGVWSAPLPISCVQLHGSSILEQLHSPSVSTQTGGHKVDGPQLHLSEDPPLAEMVDLVLASQFIQGKNTVLADSLSRPNQVQGSEWTLKWEVFLQLNSKWPVRINLFATSLNHRCSFYFKNAKNLFIHIAPYPDRRFSSRYHNILKKCPLHSPVAKGYRLVVIATRAMVCDERNHSLIVNYLRCRERTCARLLALSHSPFAYFAYIFYFSLSIFTPKVILVLCDHRVRIFTAVRCGCIPITTHFGFSLPLPADAKMAADDQSKKSSKMVWRTCILCTTRLSELCYDTHTKCEACRGQVCSSDSFCVECEGWSADFRKLYLRHKHSLYTKRVSKKNRKEGKAKSKSPRADAPQRADPPPPPPPVMMLLA